MLSDGKYIKKLFTSYMLHVYQHTIHPFQMFICLPLYSVLSPALGSVINFSYFRFYHEYKTERLAFVEKEVIIGHNYKKVWGQCYLLRLYGVSY